MDDIDGTGHYERTSDSPPPSLLCIVLDTNPRAWSTLASSLPLSKAVADLLVFINAHLAFNHANRVAVIASHCGRATWLYPSSTPLHVPASGIDTFSSQDKKLATAPSNPNKYRPFALIEQELLRNLALLFSATQAADLEASPTNTMLSGALTLALSYINKILVNLSSGTSAPAVNSNQDTLGGARSDGAPQSQKMTSRILVVSASGDLAGQYIPLMNLIFAAQHSHIPIDILKLAGDSVLLQQASYTTSGIFLSPATLPTSNPPDAPVTSSGRTVDLAPQSEEDLRSKTEQISLLPTLLFAFLPDATARQHLIPPTGINVDFRAACFCHRRVVDIGFVCSICLSIFCDEGVAMGIQGASNSGAAANGSPDGKPGTSGAVSRIKNSGACLTCGTILNLLVLNADGATRGIALYEQPRIKKKKKKRRDGVETPVG